MMFWIITGAWIVACGYALYWAYPRISAYDKKLERDEAIYLDEKWDRETGPVDLPPVPPILNQSERWLNNAREAESADDTWDGAA